MGKYPAIPNKLTQLDRFILGQQEHSCLSLHDTCFYLWERISKARFDQHPTNQLISNLKIDTKFRNADRWYWKEEAIKYAASALAVSIPNDWKDICTFVPMPPSIPKGDKRHDSRILDILKAVRNPGLSDIRELVLQNVETQSGEKEVTPAQRMERYDIDLDLVEPEPTTLIVFDDMISGGSHFKAVQMLLQCAFPSTPIWGLFLARAIRTEF